MTPIGAARVIFNFIRAAEVAMIAINSESASCFQFVFKTHTFTYKTQ